MSFSIETQKGCKTKFWWTHKGLKDRLAWLFPSVPSAGFTVESRDLPSNATFVNFVRHHRLTDIATGERFDIVEKSIRKVALVASLESRFYLERTALHGSVHFRHPDCYGVIETPFESIIFTRYLVGKKPRISLVTPRIAHGIAEIEQLTHAYLQKRVAAEPFKYWTMDFFQPWYLLRSRFSFGRFFVYLRKLAAKDSQFQGLELPLRQLGRRIEVLGKAAKPAPVCFCHMDYLRKNLFLNAEGLQLIDWSEVKIGRVGFDAGSFLASLFRRSEMGRYEALRDTFLAAYEQALPPEFDRDMALQNASYIFLLNALWQCLRPKTIQEFEESNRLPLLKEKLEFLIHHESY